jgi:hypothetical protein
MARFPAWPALIAALACALPVACGGPAGSPQDALRDWLAGAEAAAEAKDRDALVGLISPAYVDARGHDRDAIDRMFRVYFLRQRDVGLLTDIKEIALSGDSAATMTVTVGMAGTNSGTLGFSASAYRFELDLEVHDDEWMLIGARWGEMGQSIR